MEEKKQATIVDVARAAGVSVATVSRVVNGNYPVKQETKEKVKQAINSLNYVPNVQARELNTRKSSTIGVVVPGLHNMFFAEVIDGIEEAVRQEGFSFLLSCAKNDPEQEMQAINTLVARNVSGIIVISPNTKNISESFYQELVQRVPLVFINGYHRIKGVSYVGNDEKSEAVFDGYVEESTDTRLRLTGAAVEVWRKDFATMMFGVGIGGAGQALYVNGLSPAPKEIVQNEYASLLLETGIIGVALLILTIVLIIRAVYKNEMVMTLIVAYAITLLFFSGLPNALQIYLLPALFIALCGKSSYHKQ